MIYKRHYLQFNDLVFDSYDMISEDDTDVSFKTNSTSYTYIHGSYMPFKSEYAIAEETKVSITIYLRMKKLPCDKRPFYRSFAVSELLKHGKLWAVQDNTLVWAYASITNYSEQNSARNDEIEIDVDFVLPEGIWHKADKQKTFLVPFDVCDFMDCYNYHELNPCDVSGNCCDCGEVKGTDCCCCDSITEDMALCYADVSQFYECINPYKIIYNCIMADKFAGCDLLGERMCSECGAIVGKYYSDTDLPTKNVTIILKGNVKDPIITINGNTNQIKGEYSNVLEIDPDGSIYNYHLGGAKCEPLDISVWNVPEGMDFGWTIHQGNNQITISPGDCCGTVCAYIQADSITI